MVVFSRFYSYFLHKGIWVLYSRGGIFREEDKWKLCLGQRISYYLFRAQEPKAPVTYCDHALSGVRPSVRPSSIRHLHFQLLLQNRLIDFDGTWYGWSTQGPLQVLLIFGQIRPGADPGRGQNRSRWVPFFKELLLQTGRLQQQTECIAVILKHVGRSVVIFGFIGKSNFWRVFDVFLDLVILVYFNAISIAFYSVKSFTALIWCNFNIYKWENAYSKDLNAWRILMNFYLFIKVKEGVFTSACICMGTHSQP